MAFWLKLIGEHDHPLPLGDYIHGEEFVDSSVGKDEWIDDGDKILLYATAHRIVYASADVISRPYDSGRARWPARVDISFRQQPRPVRQGVDAAEIKDVGHNLLQELLRQSYIAISEEEFNRGEELLGQNA